MTPEKLLYAKTHEWVQVDAGQGGQRVATVGISSFAVEALTDLVHIELPTVGTKVEAGRPFGEIESVKAVSDLYSPVNGEIVAVNDKLPGHLDKLNDDPYEAGWMVKIRMTDESDLGQLMDHKAYQQQCAEDGH